MGKIHIFTDPPENLYLGGLEIDKVFCGEEQVWPMLFGKKILVYDLQKQQLDEIDALKLWEKAKKEGTYKLVKSYTLLGEPEPELLWFTCDSEGRVNVGHPGDNSLLNSTYSNMKDPSYVVLGIEDRTEEDLYNLAIRSWTAGGYSSWGEWITNSEAVMQPPFTTEIPSANGHKYVLDFSRSGANAVIKIIKDDKETILTKTGPARTLQRDVYYLATGKMTITYGGLLLGEDGLGNSDYTLGDVTLGVVKNESIIDYCNITDHLTDTVYPKLGSKSWVTPDSTTVTLKWTATKTGAPEMPIMVDFTLVDGHGFTVWTHSIGSTSIDDVVRRATYALNSEYDILPTPILTKNVNLWATISGGGLGTSGYTLGNAILGSMFDPSILITASDLEQIFKLNIEPGKYNLMKSATSDYGKFNIYVTRDEYAQAKIFLTSPDIPVLYDSDQYITVGTTKELLRHQDLFDLTVDNDLNLGVPGGFLHIQQRQKGLDHLEYKELEKVPFARLGGVVGITPQYSFQWAKTFTAFNNDKLEISANGAYADKIVVTERDITQGVNFNEYEYNLVQMDGDQYLNLTTLNNYSTSGAFVLTTPSGATSYFFNLLNNFSDVASIDNEVAGNLVHPIVHIDKTYDYATFSVLVNDEEFYKSASTGLYTTAKPSYSLKGAKYTYTYKTVGESGKTYETCTVEVPIGEYALTSAGSVEHIFDLETSSTGFKDAKLRVSTPDGSSLLFEAYSSASGEVYDSFTLEGADLLKNGSKSFTRTIPVPKYSIMGRNLKTGEETKFFEASYDNISSTPLTANVTLNGWIWALKITRYGSEVELWAQPTGRLNDDSWENYSEHMLNQRYSVAQDQVGYFEYSTPKINCYIHNNASNPLDMEFMGAFSWSDTGGSTVYKNIAPWNEYTGVRFEIPYNAYTMLRVSPTTRHFYTGDASNPYVQFTTEKYWSAVDLEAHFYKNPEAVVRLLTNWEEGRPDTEVCRIPYDAFGTVVTDNFGHTWTYCLETRGENANIEWLGCFKTTGMGGATIVQPVILDAPSGNWQTSELFAIGRNYALVYYQGSTGKHKYLHIERRSRDGSEIIGTVLLISDEMIYGSAIPQEIIDSPLMDCRIVTRPNGDIMTVILFKVEETDPYYSYSIEIGSDCHDRYTTSAYKICNKDSYDYSSPDLLAHSTLYSYSPSEYIYIDAKGYWYAYLNSSYYNYPSVVYSRPYWTGKWEWRHISGSMDNTVFFTGSVRDWEEQGCPEVSFTVTETSRTIHVVEFLEKLTFDAGYPILKMGIRYRTNDSLAIEEEWKTAHWGSIPSLNYVEFNTRWD